MRILVGIDLANSSESVAEKALDMARALSAESWLLHVAEPEPDFVGMDVGPQSVRDALAQKFHEEHRRIQLLAERFRVAGAPAKALLAQGPTVATILGEAEKLKADMIVIGSHGHGAVYHLLVGSVGEGVLRQADRPVLVVPTHNRRKAASS